MSTKQDLIDYIVVNALVELQDLDSSDEEAEEILDDCFSDLCIVNGKRYGVLPIFKLPKSNYWFEHILPDLDDRRFKAHLRVSRTQFSAILDLIQGNAVFGKAKTSNVLDTSRQLALVLYRLGTFGDGATLMKISSLFGISDGGTLNRVTCRIFKAVTDLETQYINMPDEEERLTIVDRTRHELPLCIGYVDGIEFPLYSAPKLDHSSYYSRKQQYSVKAQVVCDDQLRIRHAVIGYPGSVHDARIYSNSDLNESQSKYFSMGQWIAGDSAYRLTETVITPFRRNAICGSNADRQQFNKLHSSYRVRIENCFGILKNKFPSLKGIRINIKDTKSHKRVCQWILVCCILYNIILPTLDEEDYFEVIPEDEEENSLQGTISGEERRTQVLNLII